MATIISSHNRQVLKPSVNTYCCNCRGRNSCQLDNKCKTPQIVYRGDVSNNFDNESKYYYDRTEVWYGNHESSFRHERSRYAIELSKYLWELQKQGKKPIILWSMFNRKVLYQVCPCELQMPT